MRWRKQRDEDEEAKDLPPGVRVLDLTGNDQHVDPTTTWGGSGGGSTVTVMTVGHGGGGSARAFSSGGTGGSAGGFVMTGGAGGFVSTTTGPIQQHAVFHCGHLTDGSVGTVSVSFLGGLHPQITASWCSTNGQNRSASFRPQSNAMIADQCETLVRHALGAMYDPHHKDCLVIPITNWVLQTCPGWSGGPASPGPLQPPEPEPEPEPEPDQLVIRQVPGTKITKRKRA
jgi:hypothetical protein